MIVGALFGLVGIQVFKPLRDYLSWLVPTHIALCIVVLTLKFSQAVRHGRLKSVRNLGNITVKRSLEAGPRMPPNPTGGFRLKGLKSSE